MGSIQDVDPVVVVGLSVRFPQDASSPTKLWEFLCNGRSALTHFPKDRFNVESFYHPNPDHGGTLNFKGGHFLQQDISSFDAPFFSISPDEAKSMDPQQRMLLEVVYEGFENAGIPMSKFVSSRTACFVGAFTRDYETLLGRDEEKLSVYQATGNGMAMLANRISWFYDLKGPSISLDTACSSSLTAFHLACQSLQHNEADAAVVAGANLFFNPDLMLPSTAMHFLSPDSKCYSFDHRANGYSRGEGLASVIIKRLSTAIRDGDTIRAVVRGTGINQDGRTPGITLPSQEAQETLIRETYAKAGLDLAQTRFFEAHGTGTAAGDPIEAGAIAATFRDARIKDDGEPLIVGAIKTNLGHLEGTSGLAGLIKTIYALENGIIPPNIWMEKVNPKIPAEQWKLKFPTSNTPWPRKGLRRASINSFGYGGANCHVILDDAYHFIEENRLVCRHNTVTEPSDIGIPVNDTHTNGTHPNDNLSASYKTNGVVAHPKTLFVWSASDQKGLERGAQKYTEFLKNASHKLSENEVLDRLAYTLSTKRTFLPWKTFSVAGSIDELVKSLDSALPKPIRSSQAPRIGYIFTGQGAEWQGMGKELYMRYPVYADSLHTADKYIQQSLGSSWSLLDSFLGSGDAADIHNPAVSQPLCTALQVALVELLHSWGISPSRVAGHSSGEIAAAFSAGAITRECAWGIAYYRGTVAGQSVSSGKSSVKGTMMAVGSSDQQAQQYIARIKDANGTLVVACVNSPNNVTVSGDEDMIDKLKVILDDDGIFSRKLQVKAAYHSSYMVQFAEEYKGRMSNLNFDSPKVTEKVEMFSSVTGKLIDKESLAKPDYWISNLVSQVLFSQSVQSMCTETTTRRAMKMGDRDGLLDVLVEIGPHSALQGPTRQILVSDNKSKDIRYLSMLSRDRPAVETALQLAGDLYCHGAKPDFRVINSYKKKDMLIDLPSYAWNHEHKYWFEGRTSKNYRFRKFPRHDLLGAPVADWNPLEPRWRNILRVAENPWLKDHKITGVVLYPAAASLIMAIEASRQLADPSRTISGFQLREIALHQALAVPENKDGVETMLYMRPHGDNSFGGSALWYEFHVCSYSEEYDWREHCRGLIATEYETQATDSLGKESEAEIEARGIQELMKEAEGRCRKELGRKQMYDHYESIGMQYGPTFQSIYNIKYTANEALGTIKVPDIKAIMPNGYYHKHVIHPITLDNLFQFLLPAVGRGIASLDEPIIPTFIEELWVSASISTKADYTFCSYASAKWISAREARGWGVLMDETCELPQVILKNLVSKVVYSADFSTAPLENQVSQGGRQIGSYNVEWKPDISFMSTDELIKLSGEIREMAPEEVMYDLELMGITFIREALEALDNGPAVELPSHYEKYVKWMREQARRFEQNSMIHQKASGNKVIDREVLEKRVEEASVDGKVMTRIGRKLIPILKQEADALELLVKDNLLDELYEKCVGSEALHQHLATYIDAATFKNPQMEILEIGAGTGAATRTILKALTDRGKHRVARYMYTDISAGFFDKAKEKFQDWIEVMSYRTLNIEADPMEQGFEPNKYDMLVASNVLHATTSLDVTLANAKKLLKPGGKLMLMEITNPELLRTPFSFGLLPGWWLSKEKNRNWGPTITATEWDRLLQRHGFGAFDHVIRDIQDPHYHQVSMIVSTYSPDYQSSEADVVVVTSSNDSQSALVSEIQRTLEGHGQTITVIPFASIRKSDISRKPFICLAELHKSLLHQLKPDEYEDLKHMVMAASSIVWVTKGGAFATENPLSALSNGFGRVIRSEHEAYRFVKLDLQDTEAVQSAANSITRVFLGLLTSPTTTENEYASHDGTLYLSRLVHDEEFADAFVSRNAKPDAQPLPFGQDERPLKLEIASPGTLSSLQFQDDDMYEQELGPNEIEVKVKAVGLNFKDVMIAMGQLSDTWLGNECSGIITKIGKDVRDFKIGDRVCGVTVGSFRTFYKDDARLFQKIPDDMSFTEAAAIPLVYCTAYFALFDLAHMKKGESILIHAAAGGVGQAAIVLSQLLGAEIFVTVGTTEKKNFLMETYGIKEDHIFSSRDLSFAKGVMRMTKDRGVDVLLNSLSGEALRQSWKLMAPFGRFIEIGRRDIDLNKRLEMSVFAKSVTFASVAIVLKDNRDLAGRIMKDVMELVRKKEIGAAKPLTVFPFSEIEASFRLMQAGKHIGKIVLEPHDDDIVPALPAIKKQKYFDENASYLIAGGLGGLARSMVRWMIDRNLKNVILCSRSGPNSEVGKSMIKELQEKGVNAAVYACDVSDATQLASVLKDCQQKMPPIKGCIQSAMVLRDATFENMSYEDFQEPLLSKVKGSWNLHTLLPRDLDFFVMLSSASGITGTRGQANYAAGNTYQDALSHYRISQGLHSIAIDLGFILSVGYVAEDGTSEIDNRLHAWGFVGIREEEFLSMLEYCINPATPPPTLTTCQIVTGIENPALMRAKGLENPYYFRDPFFSHLRISNGADDAAALGGDEQEREMTAQTIAALRAATSLQEAAAIIRVAFVAKLCKVLSINPDDIDVNKPLHTYGVDSLVAVVIRYWLFRDYQADVAVFDIMGGSTIVGLSLKIVTKTKFVDKALVLQGEHGEKEE
ncbi:fatty acid synthase S-acetyltransferase [Xylogone sp. PMI_703]|nr:fatty acid synthase S-acetyltransferase [Xylogone sp. PMI_703]